MLYAEYLIDMIERSEVDRREVPIGTLLFSSSTDPASNLVRCLRLPGIFVAFSRLILPYRYFYPSFVPRLKCRRPVGGQHVELLVYNCMRHTADVTIVR